MLPQSIIQNVSKFTYPKICKFLKCFCHARTHRFGRNSRFETTSPYATLPQTHTHTHNSRKNPESLAFPRPVICSSYHQRKPILATRVFVYCCESNNNRSKVIVENTARLAQRLAHRDLKQSFNIANTALSSKRQNCYIALSLNRFFQPVIRCCENDV